MSKTRFVGFLKLLGGLALCSPAPVCAATGISLAVVGTKNIDAVYSEFEQTEDYEVAMQKKDGFLEKLEFRYKNDEVSKIDYEDDKAYYNDTKGYLRDCIYDSEFGGQLKNSKATQTAGIVVSAGGTLAGAVLTSYVAIFSCLSDNCYKNLIADLIDDGGYDLAHGDGKK